MKWNRIFVVNSLGPYLAAPPYLIMKQMNFKSVLSVALVSMSAFLFAQSPDQVYSELKRSEYWLSKDFSTSVNLNRVQDLAKEVKPYDLKLLAIPSLGASWQKGSIEQRGSFAKYVAEKKLNLSDRGIMIILTRKGISAYNRKIPAADLAILDKAAAKAVVSRNDFTPAIVALAQSVRDKAETSQIKSTTVSPTGGIVSNQNLSGGSSGIMTTALLCIAFPLGLIALAWGLIASGNKKKIARSRTAAEDRKHQAVSAISYIDSYDGLFKMGTDANTVRQYRDRMAQNLDAGNNRFNTAKTAADYDQANYAYQQVLQDFETAKTYVNNLTGGSGVAFTIPPVIDNDRAPLFEPVQGVSYFSSQPSNQLVPVEVNFGGARKTVMVTPDERDELLAGRMPQLRGQYGQGGQFTPWYGVQGYDPYRDYNSHNFIWDLVAISAISSMFSPHYGYGWGGGLFGGGYGGYGYGGYGYGGTVINNYNNYGDQGYNQGGNYSSSSGDFNVNQDTSDQTAGDFNFDSSGSSSSSSDSGGFDFGGGGGDSGGGFDFGGGGGDFGGGGDSGGGDF